MEPRDYTDEQATAAGAAVFHGHVESRDDKGRYSGQGRDGEPIKEALTAYPYGFRSYAPVNTGLVLTRSQAGLLVLSQEGALPSGVTEPLSGEALLYNAHGAAVLLDEDGDINVTQKSGRFVLLGRSPVDFVALASPTFTEFEKLQDELSDHTHGPGTFATASGPVTGVSAGGTHTYSPDDINATEVKAK